MTFRVLHNRPESADRLRVQVFTQTGVKVWDKSVATSSAETVWLSPKATSETDLSSALNADETSRLMGSTTLSWTASVPPGLYVYKVYLTSGESESTTRSKLLMVR